MADTDSPGNTTSVNLAGRGGSDRIINHEEEINCLTGRKRGDREKYIAEFRLSQSRYRILIALSLAKIRKHAQTMCNYSDSRFAEFED